MDTDSGATKKKKGGGVTPSSPPPSQGDRGAASGGGDGGSGGIPTRWRLPVVALLTGLCLMYLSELKSTTSGIFGGREDVDQGRSGTDVASLSSSSPEALSYHVASGREAKTSALRAVAPPEPTPPPEDPELLGYSRPQHVPQDCRLNRTKVLEAARLALEEGDVSLIEHVECLYIQDPAFYTYYNAEAHFERWRHNPNNWTVKNQSLATVKPEVKKVYATYGDRCCAVALPKALEEAKKAGFDEALGYHADALTDAVRSRYDHILKQRRGGGYWMWKPYVVLKTLMDAMDWGDYLCYVDAGSHFIRDAGDLVAFATIQPYGMWLPHTPGRHTEGRLQKKDNLILMNMDHETIRQSLQGQANHMCLPKTLYAIQMVSEWAKYAVDERCITDMGNTLGQPNYPEFFDHRHDQAIWSLTTKRWGMPHWRDGTFWSEDEMREEGYTREGSGPYMMPFNHHRIKDRRGRRMLREGDPGEEEEEEEVMMEDRLEEIMLMMTPVEEGAEGASTPLRRP